MTLASKGTITGYSRNGSADAVKCTPLYVGGKLYVPNATLKYSSDDGATWSNSLSTGYNSNCSLVPSGSTFAAFGSNTTPDLQFEVMDTASPPSSFSTETAVAGRFSNNNWIGTRDNGEQVAIVVVPVNSMGTPYNQLAYTRRTGTNTWTAPVVFTQGGTTQYGGGGLIAIGDRVHFFWCALDTFGNTSGNLFSTTLSAANGLSTTVDTGIYGGATTVYANLGFASYGTTGYILRGGAGVLWSFTSADAPTFSSETAYPTPTGSRNCTLTVDQSTGDLYATYMGSTTSTRQVKRTAGTGLWGTPVQFVADAVHTLGGIVYTRADGAKVLGVFGEATSGGSFVWYEDVLVAGAPPSGSVTLAGAGTLTLAGSPTDDVTLDGSGTLGLVGAAQIVSPWTSPVAATTPFAGALTLAGSGTLTLAGTPGVTQPLPASGDGTLTLAGSPQPTQTLPLAGDGTLTPVGAPGYLSSMGLSGDGTLTGSGVPGITGTLGLAGDGALVTTGTVGVSNGAGFSGDGTLTGVATLTAVSGDVTVSGSGTLTGVGEGSENFLGELALAGTGTLSLIGTPAATGELGLVGAGSLTLAGTPSPSGATALAGDGSLTLAATPDLAQTAAFDGEGTLSFSAVVDVAGTVPLSGAGTLTLTPWFAGSTSTYATSASGTGWVDTANAVGAPDATFASWTSATPDAVSAPLVLGLGSWADVPNDATVHRIVVTVKGYASHA